MWRSCAVLLAAAVWSDVGCSLIMDFDANRLPCQEDAATGLYECFAGFTCAPGAKDTKMCVADHTLSPNDACYNDAQCPETTLCPAGTCQPVCSNANVYRAASGCSVDRFCAPYVSVHAYSDGAVHTPNLVAACQPSDDCQVGAACTVADGTGGGICVGMNNLSRACLTSCQVNFTAGKYSDNCNGNRACVPVGPTQQQQTVCVRNDIGGQAIGAPCSNSAGQPCPRGAFCSAGVCAKWCPAEATDASTCDAGQTCCHFQLNSQTTMGYCAQACL